MDRLKIIVERRSSQSGTPDYLPKLREELLAVISKYETIDLEQVSMNLESSAGSEVLELNIVLPADHPLKDADDTCASAPASA